ncbi:MAG: POTRA domain-containing protein, partial [Patescibacteria group bacterium]
MLPAIIWAAPIDYKVHFLGVDDPDVLKTVKSASFLSTLKQKKPNSINILRSRAESDIPDILKALHSHGYYDATAQVQIVEEGGDVDVFVMIQTGAVYTIESFEVACANHFTPEELGIKIGDPMTTLKVLNAEQKVLELLSECGYPGSKIIDEQYIADYKTKTIAIHLKVDSGPEANFGSTTVIGAPHIQKELFENKIAWEEGTTYDTRLVDQTQKKLLDTGLFSSVIITHEQEKDGRVPMKIESMETKHKNINIGASYQTFFGPGLTFGWENRNVSGRGRTLSLKGDVTAKNHTGTALFFVPDCGRVDQDFAAQAQVMQEAIVTYHEHSYSITNRIERRIDTRYRFAVGLKVERLLVSNSVSNG